MGLPDILVGRLALSHIGSNTNMESFGDDTPGARAVQLWYDVSRRQALAYYTWSFARRSQLLAAHEEAPPDVWAYRYQYPSDCLKARHLQNPLGLKADPVPFELSNSSNGEQRTILTNLAEARLVYTYDNTLTEMYTDSFSVAHSFLLAWYITYTITAKQDVRDDMFNTAYSMLRIAASEDANEGVEVKEEEATWIRGR